MNPTNGYIQRLDTLTSKTRQLKGLEDLTYATYEDPINMSIISTLHRCHGQCFGVLPGDMGHFTKRTISAMICTHVWHPAEFPTSLASQVTASQSVASVLQPL